MKQKRVSATALAVLGSVFSLSAKVSSASPSISEIEIQSVEAAQILKELHAEGLVKIDAETGVVRMKGSVLQVLRATGWATEKEFTGDRSVRTGRSSSPRD